MYNPNLQWEETKKTELGLDLGFLNDRILINASYYLNRCSNQLLGYNLPFTTGFGSIPANFPATLQNDGIEFSLNTINVKVKNFTWTSAANLTIPHNKLVSFPGIESSSYKYTYVVGRPITTISAFHFIGVNDTTGVYQYIDSKGNPTYAPDFTADRTVAINTTPKYYGGISNTMMYKGFQLDFMLQFTKQIGANYLLEAYNQPGSRFGSYMLKDVLNNWKKPGDKSNIQQFTQSYSSNASSAYNYIIQSDYFYADASFIRLKNVALSWQFPSNYLKKLRFQEASIYLQAQNIFYNYRL